MIIRNSDKLFTTLKTKYHSPPWKHDDPNRWAFFSRPFSIDCDAVSIAVSLSYDVSLGNVCPARIFRSKDPVPTTTTQMHRTLKKKKKKIKSLKKPKFRNDNQWRPSPFSGYTFVHTYFNKVDG